MKIMRNSFKAASYAGIFKLSGLVKISFLVGSQMALFSGVNCVLPLSGAFGGVLGAGIVFVVRQLLHLLFFKTVSLSFLAMCVPGFCASLYWSYPQLRYSSPGAPSEENWIVRLGAQFFDIAIRLLLPLACMALFIMHPVGAQAFIYSFYWLIPVVLYFVPSSAPSFASSYGGHGKASVSAKATTDTTAGRPYQSLFLTALGSTFIAHAVGSVIWCYTVPMTPAMWLGLIPVVALERTLFALGMVVAYKVIEFIFGKIDALSLQQPLTAPEFSTKVE